MTPTDNPDTLGNDDTVVNQAQAKLSDVWAQLGFEHFRNGVYVLDLGTITLDEAVEQLRERISQFN